MNFEPRYVEENVNVPSHNHLGDFFRLSLWLLAIVLGIYFCLGFAAEKIAERLPPKYESAMAAGITAKLDSDAFPQTREYLQKVLDSLVASSSDLPGFLYKVSIYDLSDINAVALPAGNIVVFRGLLAQLKSENELAMILAHELGHYAHRDHLRGMGRGLVFLSIMTALGLSGDGPGFISPSVQTLSLKYSRDQESAADHYAIDLFARTYGHVSGALDVFKVLEHEKKGISGLGFFSTHPDTLWRMQALERYIQLKKSPHGAVRLLPGAGVLPFKDDKSLLHKPEICPSTGSGRTEHVLKSLNYLPFMLSLSKHKRHSCNRLITNKIKANRQSLCFSAIKCLYINKLLISFSEALNLPN